MTVTSDVPSLEEFARELTSFLAERFPMRRNDGPVPFEWGVGSDDINVFAEPDPREQQDALAEVRQWRSTLWDAGYGWLTGPVEYGGRALPRSYQRMFEQVSRQFDVAGDAALTVSLGMIAPTLLRHCTEEQRQRWLPRFYSGETVSCQLFSEPDAGSDLASISTRAVRDGDTWRINGQKVWTSGANIADVGEILCRTTTEPRHKNLTAFLVDMRAPGVDVRPLRQMTGGAAFNEVYLDDVVVSDSDRIGAVGEGWQVAMTTLRHEREAMGSSAFGGMGLMSVDRIIEITRRYGPADDPLVRSAFGQLMMELRGARYVTQVTAARARSGDAPGPESALSKINLAANISRLGRYVAEVLGPRIAADNGEWGTYAWTNVLLGAPGYRLGGGTDEVLKNTVAQRVLGLPRSS